MINWNGTKLVHPPTQWAGRLVERLVELYRLGLSQSNIADSLAKEFNTKITESMVAGRIRRMKLQGVLEQREGNPPIRKDAKVKHAKKAVEKIPAARSVVPAREPKRVGSKRIVGGSKRRTVEQNIALSKAAMERFSDRADGIEPSQGITIMELERTSCRWPLAKVEDFPPYRYCGCQTREGSSWCEDHYRISRDPARPMRRLSPVYR